MMIDIYKFTNRQILKLSYIDEKNRTEQWEQSKIYFIIIQSNVANVDRS